MLKVGVQSASWYDAQNPLESFEFIRKCGFDAVDYNIDHYLDTKKLSQEGFYPTIFDNSTAEVCEFFAPMKKAAEQAGVSFSQMHAPFPVFFEGMDEVNEYIRNALDKCFAVSEYIGCPAVVVHPIKADTREAEWEANLALYRSLIPIIKKYKGVKICLENIFINKNKRIIEGRLSNAADACRMIDILNGEAQGDYFGFCFDIGHANLTNRNVKEFVKELGARLTILHLHDNDAKEDLHMIPYTYLSSPSTHVCDWQGFIEGLKEIGYKGVICFETFRIFSVFPPAVHEQVLKLISAIGRYWADFIEEKN